MSSLKRVVGVRGWAVGFVCAALCGWVHRGVALDPIPQRFNQELAFHQDPTSPRLTGAVQLLDRVDGSVRAFLGGHWYQLTGDAWKPLPALDAGDAGHFVFAAEGNRTIRVATPWADVRQVLRSGSVQWVVSSDSLYEVDGKGEARRLPLRAGEVIRQVAVSPAGELWMASAAGLVRRASPGWEPVGVLDGVGRQWATTNVLAVAFDSTGRPWVGTRAGVARLDAGGVWKCFEGRDGVPWTDFTGATAGKNGEMWFSTRLGVVRWDGAGFHYRQGKLWLPSDDVRQTLVDEAGDAWMATPAGVGRIGFRPMTLAAKAEHYEQELEKYIARTPYGYVAEAPLQRAGDRSSASPGDSDNDGLWTAMYGAGECFGYGTTGSPDALRRAKKAFEALRFLQTVTQGGNPSPAPGYVARTVRPVEWPDPNVGRLAGDLEEAKRDALWKAYEPRWPKSADGRWYWKGDTSSDELDGHYFFYAAYYDLCAKTGEEKARVREVVRGLTDHLVSHGFALVDVDGKPTRWGVYGPQEMNRNPFWWVERGLNSLSILSYLAVTAHVTGDNRYTDIARELVEKHGYGQNLMFPKVQQGPGSGNQSDDEMAFMCFYNLVKYGRDPAVVDRVRYSFFQYWANDSGEMNPFFHFAHAAQNLGKTIRSVWGEFPVSPWDGWLEDSRATLYGMPMDRLGWDHKNSHRLDLVFLGQVQARDLYQTDRERRGHRVNGKVLPVENRHFNHWNTDPWDLDYGGDGRELGSGAVFLLPYYLGMYHGFVEKPRP